MVLEEVGKYIEERKQYNRKFKVKFGAQQASAVRLLFVCNIIGQFFQGQDSKCNKYNTRITRGSRKGLEGAVASYRK